MGKQHTRLSRDGSVRDIEVTVTEQRDPDMLDGAVSGDVLSVTSKVCL